jgi:cytochrome b subunit of formate dehydrogenase
MNDTDRIRRYPVPHQMAHLVVSLAVPASLTTGAALAWPEALPLATALPPPLLWTTHLAAAAVTLVAGVALAARDLLLAVIDDRPIEQLPLWIGKRDIVDAARSIGCRLGLTEAPEAGWFTPGQKLDFWLPAAAILLLAATGWVGGHLELFANVFSSGTLLLARLLHRGVGVLLVGYLLSGHLFRVIFLSPTPLLPTFLTGTITAAQLREAHPRAWREATERDLFVRSVEAGDIAIVPYERRRIAESSAMAAREALAAGNVRKAVRLLGRAMRARPDFPPALFLLGECHERLGNPGKARDLLARYLLTGPAEEGRVLATARIRELDRLLERGIGG